MQSCNHLGGVRSRGLGSGRAIEGRRGHRFRGEARVARGEVGRVARVRPARGLDVGGGLLSRGGHVGRHVGGSRG
eukprot:760833-Prymnesium_polylepis.1